MLPAYQISIYRFKPLKYSVSKKIFKFTIYFDLLAVERAKFLYTSSTNQHTKIQDSNFNRSNIVIPKQLKNMYCRKMSSFKIISVTYTWSEGSQVTKFQYLILVLRLLAQNISRFQLFMHSQRTSSYKTLTMKYLDLQFCQDTKFQYSNFYRWKKEIPKFVNINYLLLNWRYSIKPLLQPIPGLNVAAYQISVFQLHQVKLNISKKLQYTEDNFYKIEKIKIINYLYLCTVKGGVSIKPLL